MFGFGQPSAQPQQYADPAGQRQCVTEMPFRHGTGSKYQYAACQQKNAELIH